MRTIPIIVLLTMTATAHAQSELRDPTRPPTPAEIEAWFGNGPDDQTRAPFRLQSILLGPQRRIAIIDGERLRPGEQLGDAEVQLIEPGRVVLERDGEKIELTIDTHLTNHHDGSRN